MKLEDGSYGSPRWSYEILDCAMPMTFDTYSNCAHQCVYCFAFFQRAINSGSDDYLHHRVKAVSVERTKKMFLDPDRYAGTFASYIKNRFVLQWGGLSDGFDWYEKKFRKSLELLRFFREIDYPLSISTKGVWFLDDPEYVEVLKGSRNTHWKYSIITADNDAAAKLEAGTPTPAARFHALKRLRDLGVGATTLRFRPFIIGVSEKTQEQLFAAAKDAGVDTSTTEFLCIEKRATPNHLARYQIMSDVAGYDVWSFYRKHSYSGAGLLRLNYDVKRPYVARLKEIAAAHGIPLFISDAHHKESSAGAGCCGLPSEGPLSNYNKGQFSEAIQIAKKQGSVRWADIAADAEWLKEIPFQNAEGYNTGGTALRAARRFHTMYDLMRDAWNNPTSWTSPARYFGGALVPGDKDADGDIVYLYNKPYVEDGKRVSSVAELAKAIGYYNERRGGDGAERGHVAFPVAVRAETCDAAVSACAILDAERVPYTVFAAGAVAEEIQSAVPHALVTAGARDEDVLAELRATGCEYGWLIDAEAFAEMENPTVRAALSAAEADVPGIVRSPTWAKLLHAPRPIVSGGNELRIAIPTFNRPALIQKATLAYLDRSGVRPEQVDIWISGESQVPLYADLPMEWKLRMRVGARGLMANRRAAEIGHYQEGTRLVWLNDDIFSVRRLTDGKLIETPIMGVIEDGFAQAEKHGAHLWGVYAVDNAFYMKERVHTDLRYVVGCFYGVILRHDPFLQPEYGDAKEDYERALRFFQHDGRIVRMDYYSPKTIYYNSPEIFPNTHHVELNIAALEARWPMWVKRNTRKKSPYPEINISNKGTITAREEAA